jgi:Mg-chelatase subunit ChlI
VDSRKRIALFCCFKKRRCLVKKRIEARKIGMPVNGSKPKLIKISHQTSHGGILSNKAAVLIFRLAHDILAYNHKKRITDFDKTDIKKLLTNKMA